jgi:hypothetical protein
MKADGELEGAVVTRPVGRSDHREETSHKKMV